VNFHFQEHAYAFPFTAGTTVYVDMANDIESNSKDIVPPVSTVVEKDRHSGSHQPLSDDMDWDGPDDPDMPLNWPKPKRWINTMIVSILTLLTYVPSLKPPSQLHIANLCLLQ
jgi:hypothetical protein